MYLRSLEHKSAKLLGRDRGALTGPISPLGEQLGELLVHSNEFTFDGHAGRQQSDKYLEATLTYGHYSNQPERAVPVCARGRASQVQTWAVTW